jgi:hypothetical protein
MEAHQPREALFIPLSGEVYELSLLIRNTYGCGQLLRGLVELYGRSSAEKYR